MLAGGKTPLFKTVGGRMIPGTFLRNSPAWWDGREYGIDQPRFVDPSNSGILGLMNEEGTTNILTANQASLETDTAGWTGAGAGSTQGTATIARDTTKAYHGAASLKVTTDGSLVNMGAYPTGVSATANTWYAAQARVWVPAGVSVSVGLWDAVNGTNGGDLTPYWVTVTGNDAWQYVSVKGKVGTSNTTNLQLFFRNPNATAISFWVDVIQIEAKQYSTSWQIPGTARAAETTTVPTSGLLTPQAGSVIIKYYWPGGGSPGGVPREVFFHQTNYPSANVNAIAIDITSTQTRAYTGNAAGASSVAAFTGVPSAGWHQVGIRFSAASVSLWQDGASKASVAGTNIPSALDTNFYLGRSQADTNHLNQPIAYAYFYNRVLSDAEMAAATSGNPPPDFTAYLTFDGMLQATPSVVYKSINPESVGSLAYDMQGMFYVEIDAYHARVIVKQAEPGSTYFMKVSELESFVRSLQPMGTTLEVQVIGPASTGGVPIT